MNMKFEVVRNDIANMNVDAIVLPANPQLKEGSGTSTRIFEKAGRKELQEACQKIIKKHGSIDVGLTVPTIGYNLNVDFILHTVVPKWIDGKHDEYQLLCTAYLSALDLANEMGCKSIAFPLLAAGNQGFDLRLAFEIAQKSIETFNADYKLEKVYLVVYGEKSVRLVKELNIPVEEVINEKYVLMNDEQCTSDNNREKDRDSNSAKLLLEKGVKVIKEQLKDPIVQAKLKEVALVALTAALSKGKKAKLFDVAGQIVTIVLK